ncbi:SusC/RagA family TonB-linked outer membrane protein [Flavobacterium chungangensis]|uniref:SusC/RagA family TonB-linked outer membrane protein n=1 Tax=Flavobacterium chungangensis TaxID=2708132 RepID=A0ABV8ZJ95_9FLAO
MNRLSKFSLQEITIQGTVTDGNSPLPGVSIAVKNRAEISSISDYSGQYAITAGSGDTLVFSFIGFKKAFIPVQGRSRIDIVLQYDTTTLQEVKINAGYYSVKESERTGSIARITSKDIATQPVTNILAAMQGRMAGVNVVQTSGVPGGGFDIKIRGQNSIRTDANAPLYVIDGVPYSSDPVGYSQTSTTYPSVTSPLNNINPDTIESIEVLKDADATAIYGSRGANGVVLITTKKGKSGKTSFSIKASTGVGKVTRFLDLMDTAQYLSMRREAFANDKISVYPAGAYDINGTWDQTRYTDWQDELTGGTSQITDLQTNISGGSEQTQFLFSSSYHTESTVFPGDYDYKKRGGQFTMNHTAQDTKFKFSFSVGYNSQTNNQPAFDFTPISRSLAPNAPSLYDDQGNLNWANGTWQNPLRMLDAVSKAKSNDLVSNAVLSYELTAGLTVKSSFGFTDLQQMELRTSPSTIFNPSFNVTSANSSLYRNNTNRRSWIAEPQIHWEKEYTFGSIGVLAGGTFQNQDTERVYQFGSGFSSNSLIYDLASASTVQILLNDKINYSYQAFFGRINYNLHDRYYLNLTGRRDGSSRFGPGNQFASFGAIGLAWLFSKENFLKNMHWLSFGKLRGSYGTTGSDQIGDYQYLDTYTSSGISYNAYVGLRPSRLYNPNFSWEINRKKEAALEMGLLQDRIFITAAWYQNRSSNQLVGVPLAGTTGFSSIQANLNAVVQNSGWEFTLRTMNFTANKFSWITNFNLSLNDNRLISFPNLNASTYSQKYIIGKPLNINLMYVYSGIDSATGIYQFEDLNKDGKITQPDDKQAIINLNPKYFGGIQNQLSFDHWKIDFLFQFVKQKAKSYYNGYQGQMTNQLERSLNNWKQNGSNGSADYQLYTAGFNSAAVTADFLFSNSTGAITDGSYLRLKNVELSYDVPLNSRNIKCLFFLQGQNLLTITNYKDGDPEFITSGFLPPLKIITAGMQLTF